MFISQPRTSDLAKICAKSSVSCPLYLKYPSWWVLLNKIVVSGQNAKIAGL